MPTGNSSLSLMSPPLLVSHYGLPRPSILNTVYVFTVYVFMMPVADTSNYALRIWHRYLIEVLLPGWPRALVDGKELFNTGRQ